MDPKDCKQKCVSAGMQLSRTQDFYKPDMVTPIIYEDNVRGLVSKDDLKIPHSELAMHMGVAGKDIVAFYRTVGGGAGVVLDEGEGCCAFTSGLDSELLSPSLRLSVDKMWPLSSKSGTTENEERLWGKIIEKY